MGSVYLPLKMGRIKSSDLLTSLIKTSLKILKKNIPVVVVWYQGGQVRKIGSQNLAKWLENLDQSLLHRAMELDEESLVNGDEPLVCEEEAVMAAHIVQNYVTKVEPQKLPFQLHLMSKKEKSKYLCELIRQDLGKKQLVYGHPACRPSFWPQELWPWEEVKGTIRNINEDTYSGPGTYGDFLSICIERALTMHGKDYQSFVCEEQDEAKVRKKKSTRGLSLGSVDRDSDTELEPGDLNGIEDKITDIKKEDIDDTKEDTDDTKEDTDDTKKDLAEILKTQEPTVSQQISYNQMMVKRENAEVIKVDIDDAMDEAAEDDSPVSIIINSKRHDPIQITLNRLKRQRGNDS